jgi:Carboxypeptidase regulatory-like domain
MNGCKYYALVLLVCSTFAWGQSLAKNDPLPDSPGFLQQTATANTQTDVLQGTSQGTSQVQGVVQDVQGNNIADATVVLTAPGKLGERTTTSNSDGSFTFNALPAGEFRLIITVPGLDPYTSPEFPVKAGAIVQAPKTALKISTSSSVTVYATPDEVAQAQVHEQEQQRVFGVFPNFYTSYIWKAEPMSVRQKYSLSFRALVDPASFLIVAGVAGAEHYNGTYPDYGSGIEGYGKRYGAALADATTSRIVGSAVLPSLLHQDPRYFYQGSGGARSRAQHAVASVFICRGDNGNPQPNYSHLLGSLTAGAVANAYHPAASRGLGLTFETFGITIGGNIAGNLFREFVLRGLVPSVPRYANGRR